MRKQRQPQLVEVSEHPVHLYTVGEISRILRISPITWRATYQHKLPPIKAGRHKTAHAYWTDLDVWKAIELRFPDLDLERRQFLYEQLQRGKEAKRGSTEVS